MLVLLQVRLNKACHLSFIIFSKSFGQHQWYNLRRKVKSPAHQLWLQTFSEPPNFNSVCVSVFGLHLHSVKHAAVKVCISQSAWGGETCESVRLSQPLCTLAALYSCSVWSGHIIFCRQTRSPLPAVWQPLCKYFAEARNEQNTYRKRIRIFYPPPRLCVSDHLLCPTRRAEAAVRAWNH